MSSALEIFDREFGGDIIEPGHEEYALAPHGLAISSGDTKCVGARAGGRKQDDRVFPPTPRR